MIEIKENTIYYAIESITQNGYSYYSPTTSRILLKTVSESIEQVKALEAEYRKKDKARHWYKLTACKLSRGKLLPCRLP